jgi:tetratricopeptide (TPR) repeat protein
VPKWALARPSRSWLIAGEANGVDVPCENLTVLTQSDVTPFCASPERHILDDMHLPSRLLVLFVSAFAVVAADQGELRQIEESKRIFDLRRALDQTPNEERDRYYRGLIEARFGREEAAVEHLRAFLATNPDERMIRKAHDELANAFIRLGRYGEAAGEFDQVLRLMSSGDPERGSTTNARAIFTALKDVSPQTVEFGTEKSLVAKSSKLGLWSLLIEANTKQAEWVLDTGMTFSTVTESEAKRVGLILLDSGGRGSSGQTAKELPIRLAIATDLRRQFAHSFRLPYRRAAWYEFIRTPLNLSANRTCFLTG